MALKKKSLIICALLGLIIAIAWVPQNTGFNPNQFNTANVGFIAVKRGALITNFTAVTFGGGAAINLKDYDGLGPVLSFSDQSNVQQWYFDWDGTVTFRQKVYFGASQNANVDVAGNVTSPLLSGPTDATIATNNPAASDGQVLSRTGNRAKWVSAGVGDVTLAGQNNFTGSNDFFGPVVIGGAGFVANTTNLAFGTSAFSTKTGTNDTAFGNNALQANTTGWVNAAFGDQALTANTTGAGNVAIGASALLHNTVGMDNDAIGYLALWGNVNGTNNIAIGSDALQGNVSGNYNVAVGYQSLLNNNGANNAAIGWSALAGNTTGGNNDGFGYNALHNNTNGSQNVAVGSYSLFAATNITANTAVGFQAGTSIVGGINNTFVGGNADSPTASINYAAAIGYGAKATNDHDMVIGTTTENVIVPGTFTVIGGYVAATNAWSLNTTAPFGPNLILISGAATGGIPGISGFPTTKEGFIQIMIKATGDIVFTNATSFKTSDFLISRTITNGNAACITIDCVPTVMTNIWISQTK